MKTGYRLLLVLGVCLLAAGPAAAQQVCYYDSIAATAPATRFTDNGDGTVTDTATGLQWKRCSEGQAWSGTTCTGSGTTHDWQQVLQLAAAAGYAGKNDWRLPNIKELASIEELACHSPAINPTTFPATPSSDGLYWSSSPYVGRADQAWIAHSERGRNLFSYRVGNAYVRLVRGGQ